MGMTSMDFDVAAKMQVYRTIAQTTRVPRIADVAQALNCGDDSLLK